METAEVNVKFTVLEGEGLVSVLVDDIEIIDMVDKKEMMELSGTLVLKALLRMVEEL